MTERLESLLGVLRHHDATSAAERRTLRRMCSLLRWLASPFDEHADATHVTASAIVVGATGRVLLHRHKRLGVWLQPGGHIQPGEHPHDAAVREAREETGLEAQHPREGPTLVHVDIHEGALGHVHLDLRYVLFAAPAPLQPGPGESAVLAWLPPSEAASRADRSARSAILAATQRIDAALVTRPGS